MFIIALTSVCRLILMLITYYLPSVGVHSLHRSRSGWSHATLPLAHLHFIMISLIGMVYSKTIYFLQNERVCIFSLMLNRVLK